MNSQHKSSQQGRQAPGPAGGPSAPTQCMPGPGDAGFAGGNQQAGSSHQPQRISQQQAQKIPSDPDPDDPVSP